MPINKNSRYLPLAEKLKALAPFSYCAGCHSRFKDIHAIEWDHIQPHKMGGSNYAENIQALCVECHREKTVGNKATTAGSDIQKISKEKRILGRGKKKQISEFGRLARYLVGLFPPKERTPKYLSGKKPFFKDWI